MRDTRTRHSRSFGPACPTPPCPASYKATLVPTRRSNGAIDFMEFLSRSETWTPRIRAGHKIPYGAKRGEPCQIDNRQLDSRALAGRAQTKSAAPLPDAELEVLACLHDLGEAEVVEIRRALARFRPLSHASVSTLLRRLESRGLVARRKGPVGKSLLYAALPAAQATYRSLLNRMLDRVFAGDPVRLVSSLVSSRRLSRDELRRLRSIVDDLEANR